MSPQSNRLLRRLSTGLVVYGAVGIVLAVLMIGAIVVLTGQLDTTVRRVSDNLDTISATVDKTATALDQSSSTSASFAATIGQAGPTLQKVDDTLSATVTTLHELESTAAGVSILGQTPLASLASRFGSLADTLEALQGQVSTLHDNLADNQANLVALGASLSDVAVQLRQVDAILGSGEIQDSLGTTVAVIRWLMVLLVVMFAVPALVAIYFGVWIRRQMATGGPAGDTTA